jgi:hypothetical protein
MMPLINKMWGNASAAGKAGIFRVIDIQPQRVGYSEKLAIDP